MGDAGLSTVVKSESSITKPDIPNPLKNIPAPNVPFFTPLQAIPAGTAIDTLNHADVKTFTPLKLRGLTLQNRIMVSPMCQYSADDGHATEWHLVHLGGIIQRGPGLTIVEATSVTAEGRLTPEDLGLWKDSQIAPLKRIVDFAHSQSQKIAIQLGHGGRKASTVAPWIDRKAKATSDIGGWPDRTISTTKFPFSEQTCTPNLMTLNDIESFKSSFLSAVERTLKAGFDAIEIHACHGYLLHQSLSPLTNSLPEPYSGSLENRMRLLLELTASVRAAIPESMPLLVRVPASDWVEGGWEIEQTKTLSIALAKLGVDFLDVSSAGLMLNQKIISGPGYQVAFAEAVKKALEVEGLSDKTKVGAVGMITDGKQAEGILQEGKADAVLVARAFLKDPGLVWTWASELGVEVRVANQFGWGFGQHPDRGVKVGRADAARG